MQSWDHIRSYGNILYGNGYNIYYTMFPSFTLVTQET